MLDLLLNVTEIATFRLRGYSRFQKAEHVNSPAGRAEAEFEKLLDELESKCLNPRGHIRDVIVRTHNEMRDRGYRGGEAGVGREFRDLLSDAPIHSVNIDDIVDSLIAKVPVPAQLLSARKVYLVNDNLDVAVFRRVHEEMVKWGRMKVVGSKQDADVIVSVADGVVLQFMDAQTNRPLWKESAYSYSDSRGLTRIHPVVDSQGNISYASGTIADQIESVLANLNKRLDAPPSTLSKRNATIAATPKATDPRVLENPNLHHTPEALKAGIEGTIVLQAVVYKDGRIGALKVLRGLGYGLDEKAIEEITRTWKFQPGTLDGKPIDALITLTAVYQLKK